MQNFHRLLQRQIKKYVPSAIAESPEILGFFESIELAYRDFDKDHDQIERTLEISSNELFKANKLLNTMNEDLEAKVVKRTTELEKANEILIYEKGERQKREVVQEYTDHLLHASNQAISNLITNADLDNGILEAFESVSNKSKIESIHFFSRVSDESISKSFKTNISWSRNDQVNRNDYQEMLLNFLNNPKGEFYAKLKSGQVVQSSAFFNEENRPEHMSLDEFRLFDFIALPVFVGQRFSDVAVFVKLKELIWEPVHETILSNLSNAIGNLIHQKDLERKMQKDKEALLQAQKFAKISSFTIDFKEKISSFTEQAAQLLNLEPADFEFNADLINRLRKNVYQDDLALLDSTWKRAMKDQKDVRIDFRVMHGDGSLHYLNWNVDPVFDLSGNLVNVKGTLQDITDRKLLEEKAATARLIIENSPAILFRWRLADDWPVEYVSSNIIQFGYSEEDFIAKRILYSNIIHPDDLQRIKTEVATFNAEGIISYNQEYRILTSSGEVRWVEDQTVIETDSSGNVLFHQGIINDVTQQRSIKIALEESEERFRSLVQNSSDIISILEVDGIVRYESPSFYRMFGYQPEEIIGKNAFDFIHPEDIEIVLGSVSELRSSDAPPAPVVFRFLQKNGKWTYLEAIGNDLSSLPVISGLVINSRDVTERVSSELQLKEYASSLEKINKELDQFAYIVSHDLKAPLRAINNLSIWIEEDLHDKFEPDSQKNFDMLRGRIHRMEALINGILQYSRAGRVKAETISIPMNAFIADVVANLSPPENFTIQIQEDLPVIEGEKVAIEQIFSNFISNAIKYNNNPNPTLKVGYEDRGIVHCFYVQDNGPGIEAQFHEKVFAIFQTLQARDTVESTGVGLAIVKKIVEEKGGSVWLESELDQGSTFYFTLPKAIVQID